MFGHEDLAYLNIVPGFPNVVIDTCDIPTKVLHAHVGFTAWVGRVTFTIVSNDDAAIRVDCPDDSVVRAVVFSLYDDCVTFLIFMKHIENLSKSECKWLSLPYIIIIPYLVYTYTKHTKMPGSEMEPGIEENEGNPSTNVRKQLQPDLGALQRPYLLL